MWEANSRITLAFGFRAATEFHFIRGNAERCPEFREQPFSSFAARGRRDDLRGRAYFVVTNVRIAL